METPEGLTPAATSAQSEKHTQALQATTNDVAREATVEQRVGAIEKRERHIRRSPQKAQELAQDPQHPDRVLMDMERAYYKSPTEFEKSIKPGEIEDLKRQVRNAKAQADRLSRQHEALIQEHNHIQRKYDTSKLDHKKTKRDLGDEIVRLTKLNDKQQDQLRSTQNNLEAKRLEVLNVRMRNSELETRNAFLESERLRFRGSINDSKIEGHGRQSSLIPVPAAYKSTGPYPEAATHHYAQSTVSSRARAGSHSVNIEVEPARPSTLLGIGRKLFASIATASGIPRPRPVGVVTISDTSSPADSTAMSDLTLPSPALEASPVFPLAAPEPIRPSKRTLSPALHKMMDRITSPAASDASSVSPGPEMTQGYYGKEDYLARGPMPSAPLFVTPELPFARAVGEGIYRPAPPKNMTPLTRQSSTIEYVRPSLARKASYASVDDDGDVWHSDNRSMVDDIEEEEQVPEEKYSQGFKRAIKASWPYLKPEDRKIYSKAFL
ncbi:Hypothetical predicted protein [Lecanosticta acicola]|uniref:Uncharacterized protein n=1 Tax=Lecanosticta acicola TaxID=111012 RepID=A0AAI9EAJ9_9PEZI|nr:Hypothetical predicted protein [Lecanosticta acicola]